MSAKKTFSWLDQLVLQFDTALRTVTDVKLPASRENPAANIPEPKLTAKERKHSAALMRINHAGEIAAQALYQGQAFVAKDYNLQQKLLKAGHEEQDHLNWCSDRIKELNSHSSYLAPLWYSGAFFIGTVAGLAGDALSLGFLAETEKQVVTHLQSHLLKMSEKDNKSKVIIKQMIQDEGEHATMAVQLGAKDLPYVVKIIMRTKAKIMTTTAYYC